MSKVAYSVLGPPVAEKDNAYLGVNQGRNSSIFDLPSVVPKRFKRESRQKRERSRRCSPDPG